MKKQEKQLLLFEYRSPMTDKMRFLSSITAE